MYGNVGYGKNVWDVNYAKQIVKINEKLIKEGKKAIYKVMSNFHIELPYCKYMYVDDFLKIEREEEKIISFIDEPYAWGLESRRGGTDLAIAVSKKILQSRKFNVDPFYSAQLPSSVDKRAKFLARFVMLALPPDDIAFHYIYMGKITKVLHITKEYAEKEIYPFYDTNETIEPLFGEDLTEQEAQSQIDWEKQSVEHSLRTVTNDSCMRTVDNVVMWRKLTSEEIWMQELQKGGTILNKKTETGAKSN